MNDIDEIKIIDMDINKTKQSPKAPAMKYIYLKLSASPSKEWIDFFNQSREIPRHSMWQQAWIEDNYIVIDCVPEEIEKYHLRDLKEDVRQANQNYKKYLLQLNRKEDELLKEREKDKEQLIKLKKRLRFD